MKKILITGGYGQLGLTLQGILSNKFELIVTSHSINNRPKNIFVNKVLDVRNPISVKTILKTCSPDVIINCAAVTDVELCERDHSIAHSVNVDGMKNLIKYSNNKTKIIHISSDYIFDGKKGNSYSESDPPYPINYYGKTKLEAENLLRGSGLSYVILRASMLYGMTLSRKDNFFSWVYDSLIKKNEIRVIEDIYSNPMWLDQLGNLIFQFILLNSSGIYNFGSSDSLSRYEFALKISDVFDLNSQLIEPVKLKDFSFIAKRPKMSVLSNKKIAKELGIVPYTIEHCLCSMKENSILV